jgi:hypothetical protein
MCEPSDEDILDEISDDGNNGDFVLTPVEGGVQLPEIGENITLIDLSQTKPRTLKPSRQFFVST